MRAFTDWTRPRKFFCTRRAKSVNQQLSRYKYSFNIILYYYSKYFLIFVGAIRDRNVTRSRCGERQVAYLLRYDEVMICGGGVHAVCVCTTRVQSSDSYEKMFLRRLRSTDDEVETSERRKNAKKCPYYIIIIYCVLLYYRPRMNKINATETYIIYTCSAVCGA